MRKLQVGNYHFQPVKMQSTMMDLLKPSSLSSFRFSFSAIFTAGRLVCILSVSGRKLE